jgi:hypothetical protein
MSGEIGDLELGQGGNLVGRTAGASVFLGDDIFLACQDEIDHATQVSFELFLVIGISPRRVTASALDFAEVSEVARHCNQDVVHEYGGISFDTVTLGEFRAAEVLADECDLAGILGGDFLYQQTCWIGDVSSVGPSHQGDVHGFPCGALQRSRRLLRRVIGGQNLIENDAGGAPLVEFGSGTVATRGVGLGALQK